MEQEKKISFGFSKLSKKPQLLSKKPLIENKVELIESFEGNTIKVKNAVEETVKQPLVIPIKDNQKNILDRIRNARNQAKENEKQQAEVEDTRPDSELTLDELAAREVINDAKRRLEQTTTVGKVFVLPLKDDRIAEGEPESTLEDYENIPISDYGMAMLRGMGWQEGSAIGKNQTKSGKLAEAPELRPKGLGLGASKLVKAEGNSTTVRDKDGQELVLKRGALAKIIAGASKGNYCEVQGLDDEAGRVIVKTALKGDILTLHEFLVIPVTKEEYARNSKILNTAKYEEYKQKETMQNSTGNSTEDDYKVKVKKERNNDSDKVKTEKSEECSRFESSRQKDKYKSKPDSDSGDNTKGSRYVDNDSRSRRPAEDSRSRRQSPERGHGSRRKSRSEDRSSKHNGKSHKKDNSDSDLSSDSEYERRKKHHKKKDKRSRRDRSRSPKKKSSKKSRRQSSSPDSAYEETYSSRSKSKRERSRSRRRKRSSRRSSSS